MSGHCVKVDETCGKATIDMAADARPRARYAWLRRAGVAGTLFFLAKGLLWILVPAAIAWFGR